MSAIRFVYNGNGRLLYEGPPNGTKIDGYTGNVKITDYSPMGTEFLKVRESEARCKDGALGDPILFREILLNREELRRALRR